VIALRRSVDALLALPFERLVGRNRAPLDRDGRGALAAALTWPPVSG